MSATEARGWATLTPEHVMRGVRRYQWPLLVAVGVVAIALFLPGTPNARLGEGGDLSGVVPFAGEAAADGSGGGPGAAGGVTVNPTDPTVGSTPGGMYDANGLPPPSGGGFFESGGSGSSTTTTTMPPINDPEPTPLLVLESGWAQGTLSAGSAVPADALPVETRLGEITRVSFVRLTGTDTTLFLVVKSADGGPLGDIPAIKACPLTESDWDEGGGQELEEAPAHDAAKCVNGTRGGNAFAFDLAAFPDRAGGNGFALVPVTDIGVTFEVMLSRDPE